MDFKSLKIFLRRTICLRISFLFIVLFELLSLFGYLLPDFNKIAFFVILFLVLILTLEKLEYGVYIILAELILGSKGYQFSFDFSGVEISIRIGIFIVVMSVWLYLFLKTRKLNFKESKFFYLYTFLFLLIGWGIINGLIEKNSFDNIFFDANGYFFFALIFPFYEAIKERVQITNSLQVAFAALLVSTIKVFFTLYLFSHSIFGVIEPFYKWIRDTGVGEITLVSGNFYRIFFQSQLFTIIGLFFVLIFLAPAVFAGIKEKISLKQIILLAISSLLTASVLISFSRSFWVGLIICAFCFSIFLLIKYKNYFLTILKSVILFFSLGFLGIVLITGIIKFPFPQPISGVSAADLLGERAFDLTGEAAISSRWQLLPELIKQIKINPLLGSGFGTEVTYKTLDPRILARNPSGQYTTFAFEWGYLDIWIKLGLVGLIIYLLLIFKIIVIGWKSFRKAEDPFEKHLILGLLLGIIFLIVTNVFSPYLNHPLGIGYLMICSGIFEVFET